MGLNNIKKGRVTIEVKVLDPDKLLNILWNKNMKIYNIKKKNISTVRMEVEHLDYNEVYEIVRSFGGKITILNRKGFIFSIKEVRKQLSLAIGLVIFLVILFTMSNYIWAIDIEVQKNITPFELRQQLKSIGIRPGMAKRSIVVEDIEKKLENINSEILWLRVRVEGSTLKVTVEEKINPPNEWKGEYGNLIATEDGQVKKVYTYAGRTVVKQDQIVKAGDVLIEGIDGKEGYEYIIPPRGIIIANTFYEKSMKVQLTGTKLERSGKSDKDIYISLFGKKIYFNKATKDFEHYDKIEMSGKILNKVVYYERVEKKVDISEEESEKLAIESLEESLKNNLTRDAEIKDKIVKKQLDAEGNLIINVVFIVEKNIVNDTPVQY